MKTAALVAQILMGVAFTVFGLNGFLHFLPMSMPPAGSPAAEFFHATAVASSYMAFVFAVQLACGLAFLSGVFVRLALVVIAPVIVNILLFHVTMAPEGILPGVIVAALWVVVVSRHWGAFVPLFEARAGKREAASTGVLVAQG
jgi:putative oxidoreductase